MFVRFAGTILDLGTNVGWFASVGLALGHDRVFGVEANTELCTILECLATKNGWRDKLVLYNAAITDEDTRVGNVSLTFTVDNSAPGQSFSAKDGVFTSSKHSLKNITIPGGNLEFMLPTKPYIVKIDIQGMERPAMKTLRAHMLKHDYAIKHVLVEIGAYLLYPF
jgi:FkbM family methyltransferase